MSTDSFIERWYSQNSLEERFYKKIRYRCAPGLDRIGISSFCVHLKDNTEIIHRKALNKTYSFTKYNELLISKGRSKRCPEIIIV